MSVSIEKIISASLTPPPRYALAPYGAGLRGTPPLGKGRKLLVFPLVFATIPVMGFFLTLAQEGFLYYHLLHRSLSIMSNKRGVKEMLKFIQAFFADFTTRKIIFSVVGMIAGFFSVSYFQISMGYGAWLFGFVSISGLTTYVLSQIFDFLPIVSWRRYTPCMFSDDLKLYRCELAREMKRKNPDPKKISGYQRFIAFCESVMQQQQKRR